VQGDLLGLERQVKDLFEQQAQDSVVVLPVSLRSDVQPAPVLSAARRVVEGVARDLETGAARLGFGRWLYGLREADYAQGAPESFVGRGG
jgi:hypothetical protein